jgi:sulfur relay (sulfurtransferase) DsrC/TusE family protein
MGEEMGEELHEEMGVEMHDNLLPQIQIVQEILQKKMKNTNPCLHTLKKLCKQKISHEHDKLQHCCELFTTWENNRLQGITRCCERGWNASSILSYNELILF